MRADRSPPELQQCIARSFEHELYSKLRGGRSGTIKFASHHYRCQDLVLFRLQLPARKLIQVLSDPEQRNRMDTQSNVRLLGLNCKANTRRLLAGAFVCSGQPAGLANYPQPLEPGLLAVQLTSQSRSNRQQSEGMQKIPAGEGCTHGRRRILIDELLERGWLSGCWKPDWSLCPYAPLRMDSR